MSKQITFPYLYGTNLSAVVYSSAQSLQTGGYTVQYTIMGPESASMIVSKDRDGLKNIIGLGVESRVTMNVFGGNQINISIEDEWTNKIVALAIGWFFCLVPFITGIIGALAQNDLSGVITSAIQNAIACAGPMGGSQQQYQQNGYYQPYTAPNQQQWSGYGNVQSQNGNDNYRSNE